MEKSWDVIIDFEELKRIQYVVFGQRLKVINLNILPESSRNELKYSLKIAFMFLSIILKFQVPDLNILLGIRKKETTFGGPWSASQVSSAKKNSKKAETSSYERRLISKSWYLSLFNVFFFSTKYFIIFRKVEDQGHRRLARTKDHKLYEPC